MPSPRASMKQCLDIRGGGSAGGWFQRRQKKLLAPPRRANLGAFSGAIHPLSHEHTGRVCKEAPVLSGRRTALA